MRKPRLIKPKKTGRRAGKSIFGGIYLGIKDGGDKYTNTIVFPALGRENFSLKLEGEKYRGQPVCVWKVTSKFVKDLYAEEKNCCLKVVVYIKINDTLQRFRLFEPDVVRKAKQLRWMKYRKLHGSKEIHNLMRD